MPLWRIFMIHHALLMQFEAMLNKFKIMFLVIRDIKMLFYQNLGILIIQIYRVVAKIDMSQN
jgi:hypothetical protein